MRHFTFIVVTKMGIKNTRSINGETLHHAKEQLKREFPPEKVRTVYSYKQGPKGPRMRKEKY